MSRKKAAKKKDTRENMPDIFVQLRNISAKCLEISLPSTHGGLENASKASTDLESCMQIIQSQNQISQQLMDMRTDLSIRGLSKEDLNGSLNEKMQTFNLLVDGLQKSEPRCQSLMPVMTHSMDLCNQIMVVELSNRQMEEQLDDIRRKRIEIRIKRQELVRKLKSTEKSKAKIQEVEKKVHDRGGENMQRISDQVIIIQEVFRRLIMCAQVNWAEDPQLTSLLLRMSNPDLS